MKEKLPLSPHLQIYKPQITSLLSIAHRITGFGLNLALILLSLWIISFAMGNVYYDYFISLFNVFFVKIIIRRIDLYYSDKESIHVLSLKKQLRISFLMKRYLLNQDKEIQVE